MNKIDTRVLIVDDHPFFRQGLKTVLEAIDGLSIIGETDNGQTALLLIENLKPDLVFLDLSMPKLNGFQVLEKLHDNTELKKIIMTSFNDSAYLKKTFELGADGFILKDNGQAEMNNCVQLVMSGAKYISPSIQSQSKPPELIPDNASDVLSQLTKTELCVMYYLGDFLTSKEIAREMNISYRTVQNHRTNIKQKIELGGMHQLTKLAQKYHNKIKSMFE